MYRPGREDEDTHERLADAMTRPIRWDVIENNYDQLIKYATAIRVGTASTEAEFVNTLMIQDMLANPEWANLLTDEDKRALIPLFWMHIQPYGELRLNMGSCLQLAQPVPSGIGPRTETRRRETRQPQNAR
ncbi:Tn3 family transposase [Streptomyces sp. NPDC059832]|uniref:Tn3 family transposase n=1 Tax=unclassified Streptomyces TaxID=2593676 RepID=UPI00365CEE90